MVLTVEIDRTGDRPVITDVVAHPTWVDKDAGWIVRDVISALADDSLARIHRQLESSLERTSKIVGEWISG